MLKVLKIRSVENTVYTPQYNRMRFRIPGDNLNTHLNESYFAFEVVPVDSAGDPIAPEVNIGFGNPQSGIYYPTCLLKTARIFRGDSNIPLEEINHFNLIDLNMKLFEKDNEDLSSDQYEGGFFVPDNFQSDKSPFWLEGKAEIHIYLKDIFGLCKSKDFYLSETDGLQVEFELEDQYNLFIENKPDEAQQLVYSSFDTSNVVATPLSNLNNKFISSTYNASAVPPVDLSDADGISNEELVTMGAPLNNFYISVGSTAYDVAGYDSTNKRMPITLNINTTSPIIYDSTQEFKSYGVNSTASNTVLAGANWNCIPSELVYKLSGSTNSDPLRSTYLDISGYSNIVMTGSTVTTPAKLTAWVPWPNNTPPTFTVNSIGCVSKLSPLATAKTWYETTIANGLGGAIPAQFTNLSGTLKDIITNSGGAMTLSTGNTAVRTITFTAGSLFSIDLVPGASYHMYFDEVNIGTTWNPVVKVGNTNINYMKAYSDSQQKPIIFKALDETVLEIQFGGNRAIASKNATIDAKLAGTPVGVANTVGRLVLRQIDGGSALNEVVASTLTYQIPRAELVLIQESKKSTDDTPKVYSTYKMEPTLIESAVGLWQHQFILEPNVSNAFLLYPPQYVDKTSTMHSLTESLGSYRWALDNIDNTNRDVVINQALHNDKLIDTFNNTDMKIKNLIYDVPDDVASVIPMKIYTSRDEDNMYMNNQSHTLQVVLKAGSGDLGSTLNPKNLYLFKQVLKTL